MTAQRDDQSIEALLRDIQRGEEAKNRLFDQLYEQLHRIARETFRSERNGHTLQATALANEAFIRLAGTDTALLATSRRYLYSAASRAMRHILIDHARRKNAEKRGGGDGDRIPLDEVLDKTVVEHENHFGMEVEQVHEALTRLQKERPRLHDTISMRFFGGYSVEEVAEVLGTSKRTVVADTKLALAWLKSTCSD